MDPVISVIMPLYNSGQTVIESVDSVIQQSLQGWELIVADDGSTDDGPAKVRLAADRDRRICILQAEGGKNLGPSSARNRAVRRARGTFLAFLDADDLWLPKKLETQLDLMKAHPKVSMIWGPGEYFYPDRTFTQPTGIEASGLWEPPALAGMFLKNLRGTPCPSTILMRRDAFDDAGGFDETLKRGEDTALCVKIAANRRVYYHAPVLFRYRRHAESSTSRTNRSGERQKEDLVFHKWALNYIRDHPGVEQLTHQAEDNYHAALHVASTGMRWPKSRHMVFQGLGAVPGLRAKRWWRFLLDCLLPYSFSRRLSASLSRRAGV